MADGESAVPGERRDRGELGHTDLTPVKAKRPVRGDGEADETGVADDDELLTDDAHQSDAPNAPSTLACIARTEELVFSCVTIACFCDSSSWVSRASSSSTRFVAAVRNPPTNDPSPLAFAEPAWLALGELLEGAADGFPSVSIDGVRQSDRDLLGDRVDLGSSKVIDKHLLDLSR